jgi:antitoxin PrlF
MITSKLTSKARTTIPQAVRRALQLQAGDDIGYEVRADGVVVVTRVAAALDRDPLGAFDEWASLGDEQAYGQL